MELLARFSSGSYTRALDHLGARTTGVVHESLASTFDRTFSDHCVSHQTV